MANHYTSIRTRTIRLTLILGLVVISFVFYTYLQLSSQNTRSTNELAQLDAQLTSIRNTRSDIGALYRSMEHFLLDTQKQEHYSDLVTQYKTVSTNLEIDYFQSEIANSTELKKNLEQLEQPIITLQDVGLDPNKKYPGLSLSATSMAVYQDLLKTKLTLLQDEIQNGDFIPQNKTLLAEILEARILLEKVISQGRIYLANRLALFSKTILENQTKSLKDIHDAFLIKLKRIERIYKNEPDSFEGLSSIRAIHDAQISWYKDFGQLQTLSNTDHWRMDSYLLANEITPLINEINTILEKQNRQLLLQKTNVYDGFKTRSKQLFYILFFIIIAFLAYITIILASMNWMLFSPLADIADVMQQKAEGKQTADFSNKQSSETQQIITSFKALETQVLMRTAELENAIQDAVRAEATATKANQAKSVFLANISHELRTPLHGILAFTELGRSKAKTIDADSAERYFAMIEESGQRLHALVNNLLDLEQLEADRFELELQQHNIVETVCSVIHRLDTEIKNKCLLLTVNTTSREQIACYDDKKISQVVQNLLMNSIKFTPQNGTIDTTIELDSEAQKIKVTIKDSGIGIPEEELESVFDKFVQSSKTATGAGGTGLGLAISQEIIQAHNGEIRAAQPEAPGACIWFTLPIHQQRA